MAELRSSRYSDIDPKQNNLMALCHSQRHYRALLFSSPRRKPGASAFAVAFSLHHAKSESHWAPAFAGATLLGFEVLLAQAVMRGSDWAYPVIRYGDEGDRLSVAYTPVSTA